MKKNNAIEKRLRLEEPLKNTLKSHRKITLGNFSVNVPTQYFADQAYMFFFSISESAASKIINSKRINAISVLPGKCLLGVTFFNYSKCDVGPYREIALSIPVTLDSNINLPIIPLFLDPITKGLNMYTVMLAMDTEISKIHSSSIFGFPTYKSLITINETSAEGIIRLNVTESGRSVFHLEFIDVAKYGIKQSKFNTLFVNKGNIIGVQLNAVTEQSDTFLPVGFKMDLGEHPISNLLKELGVSKKPLLISTHRNVFEVLSEPNDLGSIKVIK